MHSGFVCGLLLLSFAGTASAQSVGIGTTTPVASAALQISSINKGLLIPRLSTAARTAIAAPANGLLVYDSTSNSFWYYNRSSWVQLGSGGGGSAGWGTSGTDMYNINSGNVGIGNSGPLARLTVTGTGPWGTAAFQGATHVSHFNYPDGGGLQHTYIRGGTDGSNVLINEQAGMGNVGIGVLNPVSKLEVGGLLTARANAFLYNPLTGLQGGVLTVKNTTGNGQSLQMDGSNIQGTSLEGNLIQPRAIVLNPFGGNVGIGTDYNPVFSKLEIRINNEERGWAVGTSSYNLHSFLGGSGRSTNSEGAYIGTSGNLPNSVSPVPLHFFTNSQWAQMTLLPNGNAGIGTTTPNSKLEVNGSLSLPIRTVTGNYTLTQDDYTVIANLNNQPGNEITLTLPSPAGKKGRIYHIAGFQMPFNSNASKVVIKRHDGITVTELFQWYEPWDGVIEFREYRRSVTLQSDGSNWFVINADYFLCTDYR